MGYLLEENQNGVTRNCNGGTRYPKTRKCAKTEKTQFAVFGYRLSVVLGYRVPPFVVSGNALPAVTEK
jgi:hypothetical protein